MSRLLALSGETVRVAGKNGQGLCFTLTALDPAARMYVGLAHTSSRVQVGDTPVPARMRRVGRSDGLSILPEPLGELYPHALLGPILRLNDYGVCGRLQQEPKQGLMWTAKAQKGPAHIVTNACMDIHAANPVTLLPGAVPIEITDLANKGWGRCSFTFTGPSLKGMSGSPIVQGGHIVGAVRGWDEDKSGVGLHIDQMLEGLYKEAPKMGKRSRNHAWSKTRARKAAALKQEHMTLIDRLCRTDQGIRYLKALLKEESKYQELRGQLAAYEKGKISKGVLFEKQKRTYPEALKLLWDYEKVCLKLALKSWDGAAVPCLTREQSAALERCLFLET